mgnify:CR=1 FL=1
MIVGAIPAAILGFLLDDIIEGYLSANFIIAITLIAYGIIFIVVEKHPKTPTIYTLDELDYKTSLKIGCFQCLALIPGTSRSGSTILGGLYSGCTRTIASEFSFFVAVPIMLGASGLKLVKYFYGIRFFLLWTVDCSSVWNLYQLCGFFICDSSFIKLCTQA